MNNLAIQCAEDSGQSKLIRLPLAKMGRPDTFIRKQSAWFRNALEREVVALAGSVSVAQASRIHTAAVALRRHLQVERRLAKDGGTLCIADWTALADRSVRFKETLDRALASLGLDSRAAPIDTYDAWLRGAQAEQAAAVGFPSAPEAVPSSRDGDGQPECQPDDQDAPERATYKPKSLEQQEGNGDGRHDERRTDEA